MGAMGACRSCGATVVWAKTRNGKSMPLDQVDPNTGNVRIVDGVAHVGMTGHHVSHFATCPAADKWRKK
jgi:hypothetical protein